VSVANNAPAIASSSLKATFAMRAVVDSHPALGVNGADAAATIKLCSRTALCSDADLFPAGVENMSIAIGGYFGSAAFRNPGSFAGRGRRGRFAAWRVSGLWTPSSAGLGASRRGAAFRCS
jgi:hypothetical protein